MLRQLGWEPKRIWGIARDVKIPHPRSHWAWAVALIPKMIRLVAAGNLEENEVVLIGEDSCWPTDLCTPLHVREWMLEALSHGYQGVWLGATGSLRKRKHKIMVNSHGRRAEQACESVAPCGSKLFAVTIRELRLMEEAWGWMDTTCFVDGVHHLLAASGHLMVKGEFLAGSMNHFSMRLKKFCGAHSQDIRLLGNLLPEGRLVEQVQTDSPN